MQSSFIISNSKEPERLGCLTAVKNIGLDTMILFTKGTELTIFGQLKILMMFSINLNLKNFQASKLSTYDFSTLYTTLPHHLIKQRRMCFFFHF